MPTNMIISSINYADDGTLTVDDEVSTLPAANLKDQQIVKIWRNTQTTAQIDVDFGQSRLVDFMALIRHNISTTGTIRFRLSTVSDFSTTVFDSGSVQAWPVVETFGSLPWGIFSWGGTLNPELVDLYTASSFAIDDNGVLCRYLRIDISDPSNADGYLQAGRLIAGTSYRPSINYANGVQFELIDESRVTKSRGGQVFVDQVEKYRIARFELINLPEEEIFSSVFGLIDRRSGISKDLLIIPQPDEPTTWIDQNIYGRIRTTQPIVNSALNYYSRLIEIEEII